MIGSNAWRTAAKRLAILSTAGALIACAAAPEPSRWQPPADDPPPATAVDVPEWPVPASAGDEGWTYTDDQIVRLDAVRAACRANTDIANAHAAQIIALRDEVGALYRAGAAQEELTAIRARILDEERRHWWWERAGLYALIGILGVGAAVE